MVTIVKCTKDDDTDGFALMQPLDHGSQPGLYSSAVKRFTSATVSSIYIDKASSTFSRLIKASRG